MAVLLCALLLQNCHPNSVRATEEKEPATGVSPGSAMRQRASSEPLAMQSLTPLGYSPVVSALPFRSLTTSASGKELSAAPSSCPLSPLVLSTLAAMGNSPTAPCDLPVEAIPRVYRAVPLGNKSDHAPSSSSPRVYLGKIGKIKRMLRGMPSDAEADSKPPAKRRPSDLGDELARHNEKVRDEERGERGSVHRDALNALLDVAGSEPDKVTQFLKVLRSDVQDDHSHRQALELEALSKVAKASPAMFSRCLPSLRSTAEAESGDVRLLALRALGEMKWKHYFGEVEPVPDLPRNMATILDSACPFWPEKKVGDTHLLVLIPATVDGAPFTLNLLGELAQRLKNGEHRTKYGYYSSVVRAQFGKNSPGRSYWLLMTRDVLEGSRCLGYSAQRELIARYTGDDGRPYEIPSTLEAATAILMHHVRTGEPSFGGSPWTCTRCQELVDGKYPVVVGGFESPGFSVSYDIHDFSSLRGVSGCRKF
jgi:hypothetical protein